MLERQATNYPAAQPPSPPYPTAPCTAGTTFPDPKLDPLTGPYTETSDCNYVVFGYFTNAVNNADVLSMTSQHLQWNSYSGSPPAPTTFNTIAVITTPNMTLANSLVAAFTADGYDPSLIFIEPMPAGAASGPPTLITGASQAADDYISVIRYTLSAITGNGTPQQNGGNIWTAGGNILVYRVEQASSAPPTGILYDSAKVEAQINPQTCNTNETAFSPPPPLTAPCPTTSTTFDSDLTSVAQVLTNWSYQVTGHSYAYHQASSGAVGGPTAIVAGQDVAGGTQDNNSYRTSNVIGKLVNQYPIFVVGINHSASVADFQTPTPVNNATYTGISIADLAGNVGAADAPQANGNAEFTSPAILSGSAYTVLNNLYLPGQTTPIYDLISPSAQADINNLYIHAFWRNPPTGSQYICTSFVCAKNNKFTTFIGDNGGTAGPNDIPTGDKVKVTERGYLLPSSTSGISQPSTSLLTGAAAPYLQSPYVICDTTQPSCIANSPTSHDR